MFRADAYYAPLGFIGMVKATGNMVVLISGMVAVVGSLLYLSDRYGKQE